MRQFKDIPLLDNKMSCKSANRPIVGHSTPHRNDILQHVGQDIEKKCTKALPAYEQSSCHMQVAKHSTPLWKKQAKSKGTTIQALQSAWCKNWQFPVPTS
mmetsp:Transcript_23543/g.43060  ORF Transcript_23543/g.43060 Transcript_23543/m.43060 type:complete len:100 (+) Transcript_23543:75-374(+)